MYIMKFNIFFIVLIIIQLLSSCKEENINISDTIISTENSDIELDYLVGVKEEILLHTNARFLKVFTSKDGISVNTEFIIDIRDGEILKNNYTSINGIQYSISSIEGGFSLSISSILGNETTERNVEYYIIKSASSTIPLKVTQLSKGDVKQEMVNFYPEGGAIEKQINALDGKEIEIEKIVGGDWFDFVFDNKSKTITINTSYWKPEDGEVDRNGVLRITNTVDGTVDLFIKQAAPYVKLDKTIVLIEGNSNISELITVDSNMPIGSIEVSEKLDADDPENRISVTPLSYVSDKERKATFEIKVNMENVLASTPLKCKYKIVAKDEALGLSQVEKELSIGRSMIIFKELFENNNDLPFTGYWTAVRNDNIDILSSTFAPPLSYIDDNGEYCYSGLGKSLMKNYYANGTSINIQHISAEFPGVGVGETMYMSFLFKLDRLPFKNNDENATNDICYPIIGLSGGGTSRSASVWVGKNFGSKTYRFGLSFAGNSWGKVVWAEQNLEDIGKTHLIIVKFSLLGSGRFEKRVDLFIDPELNHSEPESLIFIDGISNNPFNDNSDPNEIRTLFMLDNVKNTNVEYQIGGICVGMNWDELLKAK